VVDSTKVVRTLGKFPLPVEVIKMALPLVQPKLAALGLNPSQRHARSGEGPFLTDEGNFILDCDAGEIVDPERTAAQIRSIVGVVEHGLFLHMASLALVAGESGVTELYPQTVAAANDVSGAQAPAGASQNA
jgi:ribose 5-phosphate isomerase A